MKNVLMMMAINSWTLMCHDGLSEEGSTQGGRLEKTEFDNLHWKGRDRQRPPIASLDASDCPVKCGWRERRRTRGLVHKFGSEVFMMDER